MKLDVNLPKKKVSDASFLFNTCCIVANSCYGGFAARIRRVIMPVKKLYND